MSESQITISINRNAAIVSMVAALVLAIVYYFGVYKKPAIPSKEDAVKVIVDDKLRSALDEDSKSNLQKLGVTYLAFVDKDENLRATSVDNDAPVNLCGPEPKADESGQRSCKLVTSSAQLVSALSGVASSSDKGFCGDRWGNGHWCHKSIGKYDFHGGSHTPCYTPCQ